MDAILPKVQPTAMARAFALTRWVFGRSPWLLRRPMQLASLYGATYAAAKTLDKAHEVWPQNLPIAKADTATKKLFEVETDILQIGGGLIRQAYEAVPPADSRKLDVSARTLAQELQRESAREDVLTTSSAALRNRSNLNTALAGPEASENASNPAIAPARRSPQIQAGFLP